MKKVDFAYKVIRDRIVSGQYPPMSELSEETLQKEMGCSRTPIREALLRLAENGFILVFPSKATLVAPVTRELIDEVYEVRLINEPCICQLASRLIERAVLERLREELTNPPEFINEVDKRMYFVDKDDKVHKTILQYCGNSFLIKTMSLIYAHNDRFRYYSSNPVADGSISEHIKLIDAVISKDPKAIHTASIYHIEESKKITLSTFIERNQMLKAVNLGGLTPFTNSFDDHLPINHLHYKETSNA